MTYKFHLLHLTAIAVVLNLSIGSSIAQLDPDASGRENQVDMNTITTAVPFLMIAPDSRSGALGDAGVALSPDGNSLHWNPLKWYFLRTS